MVVLVIMGVCGSGKSSVAEELARSLQCSFRDADEFHSETNKDKMTKGIPLTDEDRTPWLLSIYEHLKDCLNVKATGIVTCSALKKYYRKILTTGDTTQESQNIQPVNYSDILFVYLKGNKELIYGRMKNREGHFMPSSLLQSQLETLEEPDDSENHITVLVDKSVKEIVSEIIRYLKSMSLD